MFFGVFDESATLKIKAPLQIENRPNNFTKKKPAKSHAAILSDEMSVELSLRCARTHSKTKRIYIFEALIITKLSSISGEFFKTKFEFLLRE